MRKIKCFCLVFFAPQKNHQLSVAWLQSFWSSSWSRKCVVCTGTWASSRSPCRRSACSCPASSRSTTSFSRHGCVRAHTETLLSLPSFSQFVSDSAFVSSPAGPLLAAAEEAPPLGGVHTCAAVGIRRRPQQSADLRQVKPPSCRGRWTCPQECFLLSDDQHIWMQEPKSFSASQQKSHVSSLFAASS